MKKDQPEPLEYERHPVVDPATETWGRFAFFVGLFGAPLTLIPVTASGSLIPMFIVSLLTLVLFYFVQDKWEGSSLGKAGAVLTVLWSSIFFAWSLILLLVLPN